MHINYGELHETLRNSADQVFLESKIALSEVKKFATFMLTYHEDKAICVCIVMTYPDLKIIENKILVKKSSMPFVQGLLSFRNSPLIFEIYYSLENDPDILLIEGHGVAHPDGAGIASYVGVELGKPTIGVAKNLIAGTINNGNIVIDGIIVGATIKTKEYAKELYVTPGNFITVEDAKQFVQQLIRPPHKLPEPMHIAHRFAELEREKLSRKEIIV